MQEFSNFKAAALALIAGLVLCAGAQQRFLFSMYGAGRIITALKPRSRFPGIP